MSFEQFTVEFSIIGEKKTGQAVFQREFAPQTTALIRFRLRKPLMSRIVVREGEINIPFRLGRVSPEDSRKEVKRGEIGYWPQSQILLIFLKAKTKNYPVNIVGSIPDENLKFFDNLRMGRSIKLEMVKPPIDETDYL